MSVRRANKTTSCMYMLGFLSGLVFIILCGSTAAYNQASNIRSENKSAESVAGAVQNDGGQTEPQIPKDLNVIFGRSSDGDEFTVQALDIEPGTPVLVRIQDGDKILDFKNVTADQNGSFSVDFGPLKETLTLERVKFVVVVGETETPLTFVLPSPDGSAPTPPTPPSESQPTQPANTPLPLPPTPTAVPPTPAPPNTATPVPTITPTPTPTPVPMESFYPNWRGEYYNNHSWSGEPAIVRDDRDIIFDWGEHSPAPGAIGINWFSVRWTRHVVLEEGYYTFVLSADDQAEVYIDGEKLLSYAGRAPSVNRVSRYIQGAKPIDFEVKYVEYWGNAHITFYWEYGGLDCCWTVNYYRGPEAAGEIIHSDSIAGGNLRLDWRRTDHELWERVGYSNPFTARLTKELQAPGQPGNYHLCLYTNGNARLWLDRMQLVSHHSCGERSYLVCNRVYLGKNPQHQIYLEFSHTLGEPFLGVLTVPAREGEPWIGTFFDNAHLEGPPVAIQTAPHIEFNWAEFAPPDTGLHHDNFSARWQRTMELVNGQYRFHVLVDDGARLRINDRTLIDAWGVGAVRQYTAMYDVRESRQKARIELDYFEHTGNAVIKLWWDEPIPTPTPTIAPHP